MILGAVSTNLHAELSLTLEGPAGLTHHFDAIIDTGFDGFLTLPIAAIQALGLPWRSFQPGTLAGGNTVPLNTYTGTLIWDGQRRNVEVDALENRPLVGTALLEGHELLVQFRGGGAVTITALP